MNNQERSRWVITLQNKIPESIKLSDFLAEYISINKIPDVIHNDLRLAAEEIFSNIVNYAFSDKETHTISIEISSTSNKTNITFIDQGIAFNPLLHSKFKPGQDINTDDLCAGGMGIHLIKSLTDQQEYNRIKQHNVFTVTRNHAKDYTKKTLNKS